MTYTFIRRNDHYERVNNGKVMTFSIPMMDCLIRQYRIMGYHIVENDSFVGVVYIENETKNFLTKLAKKA